jgi:hypothetical protein
VPVVLPVTMAVMEVVHVIFVLDGFVSTVRAMNV